MRKGKAMGDNGIQMTPLRMTQPQLELVTELVGERLRELMAEANSWDDAGWEQALQVSQLWDYLRDRTAVHAVQ